VGLSAAASDLAIQLIPLLNDQGWGKVPFGELIKPYLIVDNLPVEAIRKNRRRELERELVEAMISSISHTGMHPWITFRVRLATWLSDIASHEELNKHLVNWGERIRVKENFPGHLQQAEALFRSIARKENPLSFVFTAIANVDKRLQSRAITNHYYLRYLDNQGLGRGMFSRDF